MAEAQMDKDTLRKLIEATISSAGETDPATLPHRVRQRLEGQATGDLDLDHHIQQVLREMQKR